MIEAYVQWLVEVYAKKVGSVPSEPEVIPKAISLLRRHLARWPGEEDFIPLVAAAMADRLGAESAPSVGPFLKMLDQVADAVRHRISRAARKRATSLSVTDLSHQVAAPELSSQEQFLAIRDELIARFTLEEKAVLEMILDGVPVDELAQKLGVSVRTIYRRLRTIRSHLSDRREPPG